MIPSVDIRIGNSSDLLKAMPDESVQCLRHKPSLQLDTDPSVIQIAAAGILRIDYFLQFQR